MLSSGQAKSCFWSCDFSDWLKCHGTKFPGLLNICAKFEEIPSTSKDAIGRQTCGAGGAFRENSSHMQTSVEQSRIVGRLIIISMDMEQISNN